jgi:hypothetical protein
MCMCVSMCVCGYVQACALVHTDVCAVMHKCFAHTRVRKSLCRNYVCQWHVRWCDCTRMRVRENALAISCD